MITATPQQLRHAADIAEQIDSLKEQLNEILGGGEIPIPHRAGKSGKRNMSAAGRAAIAAAAKARGAKYRAENGGGAPVKKAKRNMSPEGRARLAAAVKARWARAKRAGKSRL
jgi:hypothetical protein